MYLLNNAFRPLSTFDLSRNLRNERDPYGGDCLYRNDDGLFTDVSVDAGIYGSVIGFGLEKKKAIRIHREERMILGTLMLRK